MIGDRWGVTDDDVARHYPCDDIMAAPSSRVWRGVTVHTDAATLWPWVTQIRWAPYSYDWIDNLGRRSPRELVDLSAPAVGGPFTTTGGRSAGRIVAVAPGESLTARIMGAVMSYVLVPTGADTTRLLLKIVFDRYRWLGPVLSVGDLVMARRQLLTLKRLAEQSASRR